MLAVLRGAVLAIAFALASVSPLVADAKGKGGGGKGSHGSGRSNAAPAVHAPAHSHHSGRAAPGVARDSHGKIARSQKAKVDFKKSHPCPATGKTSGSCPGYVIDHVTALKRGGADSSRNMQWQTRAEAKAKDKWE